SKLTFREPHFLGKFGQLLSVRRWRSALRDADLGSTMPAKSREKKASGGRQNALLNPLQPSEELAAVVGPNPLPPAVVVSKIWEYIRSQELKNQENRREILADSKFRKIFGKDKVTMFEMNKHLAQHLK